MTDHSGTAIQMCLRRRCAPCPQLSSGKNNVYFINESLENPRVTQELDLKLSPGAEGCQLEVLALESDLELPLPLEQWGADMATKQ
ncbi:hypothetical protein EYF80_019745 [Liparis tanakae]|uniref:Uncharacterized protein n=1 Tax=Liparis tanakae TaxID=230148 RepID=A0A4Z2HW56_9TELE|nr:hypothetical protein EYF80_019745 [Liparis tanakae]